MKKYSKIAFFAIILIITIFNLVACSKPVAYTISFVVDGEEYYTLSTKGKTTLTLPDNPAKEDYEFDGWYYDKDVWKTPFTANSLSKKALTEDTSVYAKWKPATYTIIFDSNGGSAVAKITEQAGKAIIEPAAPTKAGYTFCGWYTDNSTFANRYTFTVMPKGGATLYARWYGVEYGEPIRSVEGLLAVSLDDNYFLLNNIDLDGVEWTPIGSFDNPYTGKFDGNGYVISNFTITRYGVGRLGFFGYNDGIVQNLGLSDFQIHTEGSGNVIVGGLVGGNAGTVTSCYTMGEIDIDEAVGTVYAGGLVGENDGGTITDCYAEVDVSASSSAKICAGGLVGYSYKNAIVNCYATGAISATVSSYNPEVYAGGLIGESGNTGVTDCYATGDVTAAASGGNAYAYAGGLAGKSDNNAIITGCYATGEVIATSDSCSACAGGLVADNKSTITDSYATGDVSAITDSENYAVLAGGLVASNGVSGVILDCYATGDISAVGNATIYVGGLVGSNYIGTITDCYATGDVTVTANGGNAYAYAGGLVGKSDNNAIITGCYATGEIGAISNSSSAYAGGLVADNQSGTITDSYATGDASAITNSEIYAALAGGLVASSGTGVISVCYATGDISAVGNAKVHVGGLVGSNYNNIISGCYATGNISATSNSLAFVGGFIGNSDRTVVNCYCYEGQEFNILIGEDEFDEPTNTIGTAITFENLQSGEWILNNLNWGEYISLADLEDNPSNVWVFGIDIFPMLYWQE